MERYKNDIHTLNVNVACNLEQPKKASASEPKLPLSSIDERG